MTRARTASRRPAKVSAGTTETVWSNKWILAGALLLVILIAYQPTWNSGYIWDDDSYVTGNATLRSLHGLRRIWTDLAATPQYYPLVHTSFWLEYHLWGLDPLGYHLVNVLLHAGAALLLWRLLVNLRLPGAWLAAAIFALHPIETESVAWITERKNVLSALFYFSAALAYLRFVAWPEVGKSDQTRWPWYFASLVLFVFALLSKTVTCTLPAALLLVAWWKTGRVKWRDVLPLLPFFAIGLGLGAATAWIERHHLHAEGAEWSFTFAQRVLIAGRAFWFYAGKIFWPVKLTFMYPRWLVSVSSIEQWLFPLGAVTTILALWWSRARIGRGPLVAALFFAGTLFPALGFINVYPFRYSFVADHFQYLAGIGLIALAAAGLVRLPRFVPAALLAVLAILTWRQAGIYRNLGTLWRDTVEKNPASWMAQNNLAMVLLREGNESEALAHYEEALKLDASKFEIHNNLGYALMVKGRVNESIPYFQKALELEPNRSVGRFNLGHALLQLGDIDGAMLHLQKALEIDPAYVPAQSDLGSALLQKGRVSESYAYLQKALEIFPDYKPAHFNLANTLLQMDRPDEAISHLQKVLASDPGDAEAQKNMAWVLATWPEARIRNGARAVELAERANRRTNGRSPIMAITLAAAYAEAGRFPDAIRTAEEALQQANDAGATDLAEAIRAYITLYRAGQPYRDVRPSTAPSGGQ